MAEDWFKRDRLSRLASVLYPNLADAETRKGMAELARREGKRAPGMVALPKIERKGFDPGLIAAWKARARKLRGE